MLVNAPEKMLIVLLHLKNESCGLTDDGKTITEMSRITNFDEYKKHYMAKIDEDDLITFSSDIDKTKFSNLVIINNFEDFIKKSAYLIKGKQ